MFTHLHVHSDRSCLDSIVQIPALVTRVKELGMNAIAVTDHGVANGLIFLYKECKKQGIKPILGMEAYLSPTDDHFAKYKMEGLSNYYHLNLIALNAIGVSEIYELSSLGWLEGFYYKPRISLLQVEEIGKNLLVLGACIKGPVSWNLEKDNKLLAYEYAARLKESFGDRFYLELMDHQLPWQENLNNLLLNLSKELEIPWVPTNDTHFINKEDHYNHSLMMCLQLNKKIDELKDSGMYYSENCYLKSPEEMISLFGLEACQRTIEITNRINIELELGNPIFPNYIP